MEKMCKKPRLEISPAKITQVLPVTTEVANSFSFGSVTITKVNTSEADNKENSVPNVMSMDVQNDTEAPFETSTNVEEMETENEEEKSPLLIVNNSQMPQLRAASILRLTQYKSPQVARRSSIKKPSQHNWPSGSQENWIAHGPNHSSTPTRSSIKKNSVTPEVSSPISKKKRVSFNDPPVTIGLLYDPATNFGRIRRSDSNEAFNSADDVEQQRSSTSSDDSVIVHAACSENEESTRHSPVLYNISTQCDPVAVVKDASTQHNEGCENAINVFDNSTQCDIPVAVVKDASTQHNEGCENAKIVFDNSTQCNNPVAVVKDASTQHNEGCENAKHASTPSINTLRPQTIGSTQNIDFLSMMKKMLGNYEIRLVFKD